MLRKQRHKTPHWLIVSLQKSQRLGWGDISPLPELSVETPAEAE
nr:hypothetical protein [Pectobacterium brasiliense]